MAAATQKQWGGTEMELKTHEQITGHLRTLREILTKRHGCDFSWNEDPV
jgi:hypothetical protein